MIVIPHLTVAQTATIINALVVIIQYTLGMALIAIFICLLPPINTANTWSAIARTVQSSTWHTIMRSDSTSGGETGLRIFLSSRFIFFTTILVTVVGVITPLGLQNGPLLRTSAQFRPAHYVPDLSPIALATSPRDNYAYSRICGGLEQMICPGYTTLINTSAIVPKTFEIFSSTSHGPFNMQFRQFYNGTGGYNFPMLTSNLATSQSFILNENIFAVEGLIIDMGKNPGVGLRNHTLPSTQNGGSWSEEVFWLEPVSACVDTNLTFDYKLGNNSVIPSTANLTDRGGFVNLGTEYPFLSRDGQTIDISQHAYKEALLSNDYIMKALNLTRNASFVGRQFPLNIFLNTSLTPLNQMKVISSYYLVTGNVSLPDDIDIPCAGYGGGDIANITNVGVHCGLFLGPPTRTDGGDPRVPGDNSTWTQSLHSCASVTRARLQMITFSFNGTDDLGSLRIERQDTNTTILWGLERSDLFISDVNLYWGHVDDKYENDPYITTIRSETFYVPAGGGDYWDVVAAGQPDTVPGTTWSTIYSDTSTEDFPDYTGQNNFAILNKFQTMLTADPNGGSALARNLVWTDIVANNLVGSAISTSLSVQQYKKSVAYDTRYGIPAFILFVIWALAILSTTGMFMLGRLKISEIKEMLTHTSVGRVIMGDSAFRILGQPAEAGYTNGSNDSSVSWAKSVGKTPVAFGSKETYKIPTEQDE